MGLKRLDSIDSVESHLTPASLNGAHNRSRGNTPDFDEALMPLLIKPKPKDYSSVFSNGKGITLVWHDLSVYVPSQTHGFFQKKERHRPFKRVLNNVSGIARPGSMMAVMGASGAGKTTLMNILAYRAKGDVAINGEIRVNGIPIGSFMGQVSGYVYQDDLFYGTLTVAEHLAFMARMKLDRRLGKWERERRIQELMVELGLKKCEHTRIGIPGQTTGLSGGEKKRLAFASEVLTDPNILFCDEPTTGLDSYSAQKLVGMMRTLASKGKTIICTIHQPSSQVFSMFDQVCLLAEGRTAYIGPSKDGLTFFNKMGYVCPEHFNPADFYIRNLAVYPGREKISRKNLKLICDTFSMSQNANEMQDEIVEQLAYSSDWSMASYSSTSSDSYKHQMLLCGHVRRPLWLTQTAWLTWRGLLDSMRNPKVHAVRFAQKMVVAFIIGICFLGLRLDQMGIQGVQGAIFVFITENTFPCMYGVIHVFPNELPLFLRETKGGLYNVDSYCISKMISLAPGFIIEPLIFTSIAYWLAGLRPELTAFATTCLVTILIANVAASCGMFFSAAFEKVSLALTCLVPFDYIMMITGGLFLNIGVMPSFLAWMKYLSWFMYGNEAISIVQWSNITNIECPTDPNLPCLRTGEEVLDSRSFSKSHEWYDYTGLVCLYLMFNIGSYLALLVKSRKK